MALLKLAPTCKDYLWGGHRLVENYHKDYDGDVLAETWELSCYPDSPSTIVNGEYAGKTLAEYLEICGEKALGTNCSRFKEFPVLIKFIDAKGDLSIQVHPSDDYAYQNEGQPGKTEMWYVVEAEEGASLYYGFEHEISKEEFRQRIEDNTLTEVLHSAPVKKGDVFFIASGTLHAIGKGILIAEIQQNSNVTYRIFDYGRKDKNGQLRELHVDKALDVTELAPVRKRPSDAPHVASCPYFIVDKLYLDGNNFDTLSGTIGTDSFAHILFLDGEGEISCGEERLTFVKGDSFFLPAGSGAWTLHGCCEALMTTERND
ncbi:mannose-6-phosphate isomerase, type 1 [Lachnospiraceae bacterium C10]|nr:mannose-6-phosphate isomerase, type 1 [Lachnospiraceae bacterium C10]